MNTVESARDMLKAIRATRNKYSHSDPAVVKRYRELMRPAKRQAQIGVSVAMLRDARRKITALEKQLAAAKQSAPIQTDAEKWHDTKVLDLIRMMCKTLGISTAKPYESIALALSEKDAQIRLLQQEMAAAQLALETERAKAQPIEKPVDIVCAVCGGVNTALKTAEVKPAQDDSMDAIMKAAEKIGLEKCDPHSIAQWMISTNSEMVIATNSKRDLQAQLDALKAKGKPAHMRQLYTKPKDAA